MASAPGLRSNDEASSSARRPGAGTVSRPVNVLLRGRDSPAALGSGFDVASRNPTGEPVAPAVLTGSRRRGLQDVSFKALIAPRADHETGGTVDFSSAGPAGGARPGAARARARRSTLRSGRSRFFQAGGDGPVDPVGGRATGKDTRGR